MKHKICIIWLHGLGADANNMRGLAEQLHLQDQLSLTNIYLNAPYRTITINANMRMRAWYDIVGDKLTDREDQQGITASQTQIMQEINTQLDNGFQASQIFVAGFSQGGAMSLYTALHTELKLGGVIVLSGYLPLIKLCQPNLSYETPFFIAYGSFDQIVLPDWTKYSINWLKNNNYNNITNYEYPMEHSVCQKELLDLAAWLQNINHIV